MNYYKNKDFCQQSWLYAGKCCWKYYKDFLWFISCLGTFTLIMDSVKSNHLGHFYFAYFSLLSYFRPCTDRTSECSPAYLSNSFDLIFKSIHCNFSKVNLLIISVNMVKTCLCTIYMD